MPNCLTGFFSFFFSVVCVAGTWVYMKMFASVRDGRKESVRWKRGMGWGQERRGNRIWICDHRPLLAEDVQVDGGGFPQSMEDLVDLLDVQPLLRLPLPAPQHDIIHLFGADSGPLQNTALGDALNDLEKRREQGSHRQRSAVAQRLRLSGRLWLQWCPSVYPGLEIRVAHLSWAWVPSARTQHWLVQAPAALCTPSLLF